MNYKFNDENILYRKELNGVSSITVTTTHQTLYLNPTLTELYETRDTYSDTDELAKHIKDVLGEAAPNIEIIEKDYIEALFQFRAYNAVTLSNEPPQDSTDEIRVAGECDYHLISEFTLNHFSNELNYFAIENKNYFSAQAIRIRQFNNNEYNILAFDEDGMVGNLVVGVPPVGSVFSWLGIQNIVFDNKISTEKQKEYLAKQIEFVRANFGSRYNKIRIYIYGDFSGKSLNLLKDMGFKHKCCFEKEIDKTMDLNVYDFFIN